MQPEDDLTTSLTISKITLVKFGRVVFELCEQTDRQTDRQTDILITILCTSISSKVTIIWQAANRSCGAEGAVL